MEIEERDVQQVAERFRNAGGGIESGGSHGQAMASLDGSIG